MESRKIRQAIIAVLVSFFALSLAFTGDDESATPAEEDEMAAREAAAEDEVAAREAAAEDEVAAREAAAEDAE